MLTSDISLTITATRRPSLLFKILFKRVVLPAPKNPESTVTGSRLSVIQFPLYQAYGDYYVII